MKAQVNPGFWSTSLDEKLFRYLHQVKVATTEQINRDIYQFAKISSLQRRLHRLQSRGFVRCCYQAALGRKNILSLTERGFKKFVSDGSERAVELKSQAILHDIALVDVRFHLLKSTKISRFYSENELKTWNTYWQSDDFGKFIDVRCDGVAAVNLDGGSLLFAVELETVQKNRERSQEIIAKYYQSMIPVVLFVCGDDSIRATFLKLESEYLSGHAPRKSGKFFYVLLSDLLKEPSLVFADVFSNRLLLGENPSNSPSKSVSD